jgi:hypothetical protein
VELVPHYVDLSERLDVDRCDLVGASLAAECGHALYQERPGQSPTW